MGGLSLNRNLAPAEIDNIPDDLERDMQAWARDWPQVRKAIAGFEAAILDFRAKNRDLGRTAGRKASGRGLLRDRREAGQDLVACTAAMQDALGRLLQGGAA